MRLYAEDKPPVEVKSEATGECYRAGVILAGALDGVVEGARKALVRYSRTRWGEYDAETDSFSRATSPRDVAESEVFYGYYSKYKAILAANAGPHDLDLDTLVNLPLEDPEFFEACYQAAIEANPRLDPDWKPATTNDGEEALKKKGSSQPVG